MALSLLLSLLGAVGRPTWDSRRDGQLQGLAPELAASGADGPGVHMRVPEAQDEQLSATRAAGARLCVGGWGVSGSAELQLQN